jgi:hypothetical protein
MPEISDVSLEEDDFSYFEDEEEINEEEWVPEWWWDVEPELDIEGDEPPAEWESQLGLRLPHYWYRSKCLRCDSYVSWRDRNCERCSQEVQRCRCCDTRPIDFWRSDDRCAVCWEETVCRICGEKPRVSGHRCDTCRKYFERNNRERPSYLIERRAPGRSWRELRERQGITSS